MTLTQLVEAAQLREVTPLRAQHAELITIRVYLAVDPAELVIDLCHLVFHLEGGEAGDAHHGEPTPGGQTEHAHAAIPVSAGQGGADVRSAARSRAERARGLRSTSSGDGRIGRRVSTAKVGARCATLGRCREPPVPPLRARRKSFTL